MLNPQSLAEKQCRPAEPLATIAKRGSRLPREIPPTGRKSDRDVLLAWDPKIRMICDQPIQPGGWWARARKFSHSEYVSSQCTLGVESDNGWCPP